MNQESILIGLIALAAGIFVTRLILKSSTVQRDKYDNLKDDLASTRNELDTKFAVEKELRKTIDDINSKVVKDQEIHRTQENNLASLRATISSLQERFSEERSTNLKQQENIGASNDRILFLKSELAKVEVEKNALEQKVGKQFEEFEESRKKSLFEFENIANKLFDEKTTKFSKQSIENIEQL
ncbi:MAG: uncharacterized membrane-anchored protein YhcB (DUF1043 family), partial [Spirosomataceae bacterium]